MYSKVRCDTVNLVWGEFVHTKSPSAWAESATDKMRSGTWCLYEKQVGLYKPQVGSKVKTIKPFAN